ncbi:Chorismate synthase [seawater metagenome]|uniref:chorismate synthase n=1 Tax=seawater metagenome TaxID=1561972 RepID=A0A5E8CI08_9ZZZZ
MSTFGRIFKISTFGESHCKSVGVTIEGCPSKLELSEKDIQPQLSRRRPGQSHISTPRDEKDKPIILSGTENGLTLGTPICVIVNNENTRKQDYGFLSKDEYIPRPSHADLTYNLKYGIHASSGGGRSSARETIGRVIAGSIAEKWLKEKYNIEIIAWTSSVGNIESNIDIKKVSRQLIDCSIVRCPNLSKSLEMEKLILELKEKGDSIGGTVTCVIKNSPSGLGEPCFDKLEAMLAHAMLSIPSTKGFEIGSGFEGTKMKGSEHNDIFINKGDKLGTLTNYSGGIQGGISNGENIIFKVAFKPPSSISMPQETTTLSGKKVILEAKGRHDPCVVNRAVPIVEAMAALVLMDNILLQNFRKK